MSEVVAVTKTKTKDYTERSRSYERRRFNCDSVASFMNSAQPSTLIQATAAATTSEKKRNPRAMMTATMTGDAATVRDDEGDEKAKGSFSLTLVISKVETATTPITTATTTTMKLVSLRR